MKLFPVVLAVPDAVADRCGRDRHRQLQTLARQAVLRAAKRAGHLLERFDQDPNGAPRPWGGIFWSLSHKPSRVAGVTAAAPVGIDLETLRPMAAGMYARTGQAAEWDALGGRTPANFFRLWTAKEAVLKAVGTGLRDLGRCGLIDVADGELVMTHAGRRWTVRQRLFGSHLVAVTAASDFSVEWDLSESPLINDGILPSKQKQSPRIAGRTATHFVLPEWRDDG